MSKEKICRILEQHSIPYKIVNGRILADSMISGTETFEEVKDVTDITFQDLLGWLGY